MSGKESANESTLKPGKYRHYKGSDYQVYEVATHSEDETFYVVYRPLYGEGKLWIRPLEMFTETVEVEGKLQPRFAYIGETSQESKENTL